MKYYLAIAVFFVLGAALGGMYVKILYLESKPAVLTAAAAVPTQPTPVAPNQPAKPNVTTEQIKALWTKDHISFGDVNRKVLFVEISDPSCPYCHFAAGENPELSGQSGQFKYVSDGGSYVPPVKEMRKLVESGKASFVWLYSNGHGSGELAAQAFYCANEKGLFWPVHDQIMSNKGYDLVNNTVKNDKTKIPDLVNFLSNQIDSGFMTSCLTSGKYATNISADQQVAASLGFAGTPDFFVNTTNFGGAVSYKQMESVVNSLL